MLKTISAGILLGVLILMPITARGQANAYLGPHLGIQNSSDAENANYLAGVTLRLKLMPVIAIEGDIGYRQSKYGQGALTVRQWPATATALLYPLPFLYGGIGGGWYNTTFDYADNYNDAGIGDDTSTEFGWHLAAGIEIPASSRFKLFGDIRFVFLDYKFKDLPEAVLDGADSDFYSINLGVLFQL